MLGLKLIPIGTMVPWYRQDWCSQMFFAIFCSCDWGWILYLFSNLGWSWQSWHYIMIIYHNIDTNRCVFICLEKFERAAFCQIPCKNDCFHICMIIARSNKEYYHSGTSSLQMFFFYFSNVSMVWLDSIVRSKPVLWNQSIIVTRTMPTELW